MKTAIRLFSCLLLCMLFSCRQTALDRQDYIAYLQDEENGSVRKVVLDELTFTFQYRPYDLMFLQESRSRDEKVQMERVKDLEGTLNFVLKIKTKKADVQPLKYNVGSLGEYNQRLAYYMSEARQDFKINYGGAVLTPTAYVFETNYGLTPEDAIVLQFSLPNGEKEIKHDILLSFHDRIFGNGIIKTKFSKTDLTNIPKLNV